MKLSICMMVKNESKNLERCLNSISPLMNSVKSELIIIDTGSTDDTIDIAKKYTDKIYEHPWNDNFSQMRNKSISYAVGDWIFILDADEELKEPEGIVKFLNSNVPKNIGAASIQLVNIVKQDGKLGATVSTLRLFRNGNIKYVGEVHNLPTYEGSAQKVEGLVYHYGYIADDQDLMDEKFKRTSKLLIKALHENPNNVYYWYQLGVTYSMHCDTAYSVNAFDKGYELIRKDIKNGSIYLYYYGSYVNELVNSNRYIDAVKVSEDGLAFNKDYVDLWYYNGISNISLGSIESGIRALEEYLFRLDGIETSSIIKDPSIQLYTLRIKDEALYNLAYAYSLVNNDEMSLKTCYELIKNYDETSNLYVKTINLYVINVFKLNSFRKLHDLYQIIPKNKYKEMDKISYHYYHESVNQFDKLNLFLEEFVEIDSSFGQYLSILNAYAQNEPIVVPQLLLKELIHEAGNESILLGLVCKNDVSDIFISIDLQTLMNEITYLSTKFPMFKETVIDYVHHFDSNIDYKTSYVLMQLSKYLALSEFEEIAETAWFDKYVNYGTKCILFKYSEAFLKADLLSEYKNSEEQYLACLWNIINTNSKHALDAANAIFPEWKKLLLKWLSQKLEVKVPYEESGDEMSQLRNEIKLNIYKLLNSNHKEEAINLINEFLSIFPGDEEFTSVKNTLVRIN